MHNNSESEKGKKGRTFFSQNLRFLRVKYKLSQYDLSRELGIPRDRIKAWELNRGHPKGVDMEKLVHFFKVSHVRLNRELLENSNDHLVSIPVGDNTVTDYSVTEVIQIIKDNILEVIEKVGLPPIPDVYWISYLEGIRTSLVHRDTSTTISKSFLLIVAIDAVKSAVSTLIDEKMFGQSRGEFNMEE